MITVAPDERGLAQAAEAIHAGQVVAYPTETVYGLAVDPFSEAALEHLFAIKTRDRGKPVLLVTADLEQLRQVVAEVSPRAEAYAQAFWPGPLSLLFPAAPGLPSGVTGGSNRICVRCPGNAVARALCEKVGHPITSTSANLSGEAPATSLEDIVFDGVAVGIDGGRLPERAVSTVYDPETSRVLRAGAISERELMVVASQAKIRPE